MVGHPVSLRGAQLPGIADSDGRPTVLSIAEQDFIGWFLDRLDSDAGRAELGARDVAGRGGDVGELRVYQPVHRSFNLVVVEVYCEVEGLPRLDPKKILRAGATIRRLQGEKPLGWMKSGGRILGWRDLPVGAARENARWDPDPQVRATRAQGRNKQVLKFAPMTGDTESFAESFAPLYPAPPEICKKLGRTLLYGYLPLTSSERSEDDPPESAPFDADLIKLRLPVFLRAASRLAGEVNAGTATAPKADASVDPKDASAPEADLAAVIAGVSYLAQEPGLFTRPETKEPHATDALRDLLTARTVEVHGDGEARSLMAILQDAYNLLIRRANDDGSTEGEPEPPLHLPIEWPEFTEDEESQFVDAIMTAMNARWAALSPGQTRYQDQAARYEIQAFVRVDRSDCQCPPETVWTRETAPIEIIPWYEGGEAPPTLIELPAPDRKLFDKLKPNVAFKVPEEIQQFMSGLKLDKLMEGEKPDNRLGWGMICGFSIPIITICAFIVLMIFLSLFHILFWWLPFIRICIPFPKK